MFCNAFVVISSGLSCALYPQLESRRGFYRKCGIGVYCNIIVVVFGAYESAWSS